MKRIYFLMVFSCLTICANSQSVGIGTTTPNPTAALDIKSSNLGILIPRTSTTTRLAIVSPAKGLLIYDTTLSSFWYYNGTAWTQLNFAGSEWAIAGNAGTNPATNFVGTTDAQPLVFKVNNARSGFIDSAGANTGLGYRTLDSITSGKYNTALGYNALISNNSAIANTAVGYTALSANTTGFANTASGYAALTANTTGGSNVATGTLALSQNVNGAQNTAEGFNTLGLNVSGNNNTANGFEALASNTIGNDNVASGINALLNNQSGYSNVAIGTNALFNSGNISNTVAIGDSALFNNGTGVSPPLGAGNSAIGSKALFSNTIGQGNTATGYWALYGLTTASLNTGYGYLAMWQTTNSGFNTAIGSNTLYSNVHGASNTAVGNSSLFSVSGSDNTGVGDNSDIAAGQNNSTVIGEGATTSNSNTCVIGNFSVTTIGGAVGWSVISDGRFKKNIATDVPGLSFITQLRPVTYSLDIRSLNNFNNSKKQSITSLTSPEEESIRKKESIVYSGLVAQEVEEAANKIGYNFSGIHKPENDKDNYSLDYGSFVVPLIKAVQEQQAQLETQQQQINSLLKELQDLKNKVK